MIPLLLTAVYAVSLLGLLVYTIVGLHLAWLHRRFGRTARVLPPIDDRSLPRITVQLPLFNERHVAQRLLKYVSRFDYPRDKLEIQVLDDSTDDTPSIVRAFLTQLPADIQIVHIRRSSRDGYKAGALRDGLAQATGEFIAVFDADFCPTPGMLRTAIRHFQDPRVAVVQMRWGFLNEGYSMLTRLQAFVLRTHFVVEQPGRMIGGFFANFNGSGGVWRRSAIDDAGGWRPDTVTEDLDLSYRAQLRGWRIVYLEQDVCDCELPVDMDGFRSQQFRWIKGGAENARLHALVVLRSNLRAPVKLHACVHLLASTIYVLTLAIVVSSAGSAFIGDEMVQSLSARYGITLFFCLAVMLVFREAQDHDGPVAFVRFLPMMVAFLIFTLGICLHNAIAALSGWFGGKTEFVRTPKYGIIGNNGEWAATDYASRKIAKVIWLETALLLFVAVGLITRWRSGNLGVYSVEVLALAGLTWTVGLSLWHVMRARMC